MLNHGNEKSASSWIEGLFKKCYALKTQSTHKTYYAHRYQSQAPALNAYSSLFYGLAIHEAKLSLPSAVYNKPNQDQWPNAAHLKHLSGNIYKVVNRFAETPDCTTFQLLSTDGPMFDYLPGQYVTLAIAINGQNFERSYSLASSPSRTGCVEITVKRVSDGLASNWLNDQLNIGGQLTLKGPYGKFSCAQDSQQKLLLLAAGSGIVPIMSMLRWLGDTNSPKDIWVLLSFRSQADIIYQDELKLIAAHHSHIHIAITITSGAGIPQFWPGLSGRINKPMLAELIPDLAERSVYLCGPEAFMAETKQHLQALDLPASQLHCEYFNAPKPASGHISPANLPQVSGKTGTYQVCFSKSQQTVTSDGQTSVLMLAEQAGVYISHHCLAGTCGECMVKCLSGDIVMTDQAEIDGHDRQTGWVYACCSYPASDVAIDA